MFDFKRTCSEITFKDFLNFLRATYQISSEYKSQEVATDCRNVGSQLVISQVELNDVKIKSTQKTKLQITEKRNDGDKYSKMPFHDVKKSLSFPIATCRLNRNDSGTEINSRRRLVNGRESVDCLMKCKLNEVIQEGLMDAILPGFIPKFRVSNQQEDKEVQTEVVKKPSRKFLQTEQRKKKTLIRRMSLSGETEVEIHVYDEVNNIKKDFKCSQNLLISRMEYFADLARGHNLENMNITVHCDVKIFEWLMQWITKGPNAEGVPLELDAANVVPILVSAEFFQMYPLLDQCFEFLYRNITEILKMSTKLHCLSDNIITRLAEPFSNSEVEALNDPEDKLQSQLFCKLITFLAEPTPNISRGHYASLAHLHRCASCGKLILWKYSSQIPCHPKNVHINISGDIGSEHVRDTDWSLCEHIKQLKNDLHSWRVVYWRLWAECHFLHCSACNSLYPVHQARWCLHHPEQPQFFASDQYNSSAYPVGRYPCCGDRAYRFELLPHQSGCQFKDHIPSLRTGCHIAIHKIFVSNQEKIALEPPQLMFPERITYFVTPNDGNEAEHNGGWNVQYWWEGLELAPSLAMQNSLLSKTWNTVNFVKKEAVNRDTQPLGSGSDSDEDCQFQLPAHLHYKTGFSGHDFRKNNCRPPKWAPCLSARQNQDNQREYEECAMQVISAVLTRQICSILGGIRTSCKGSGQRRHRLAPNFSPPGGTYIRLEKEWKETQIHEHRFQDIYFGRPRTDMSSSASNTTSRTGMSSSRGQNQERVYGHYQVSGYKI